MKNLFNPDNILWSSFSRLSDWFMVSICWMVCCIPVVTIAPATIALYDTVARCIRGGDNGLFRRFFRTFKNELGRGVLLTIMWGVICVLLSMGYQVLVSSGSFVSVIYFCALFVPLGVMGWVVALESRFVYSFGTLHKNAFIFTFAYLPQTFVIVAILVASIFAVLVFPFMVVILPGIAANLQSVFIEKVLKKYIPEEEA